MGMLKGPLDYYGIAVSAPTVFGGSGHGFLINVDEQIAVESVYVWNYKKADPLVENLGLRIVDLGWYSKESSKEETAEVEMKLCDAIDRGVVCAMHTGENQLITGYDDTGFFTTSPHAFPSRLTFGSMPELRIGFTNYYLLEKVQPASRLKTVLDSLDYAVDLHMNPSDHAEGGGPGIGPQRAYTNWIKGAPTAGSSHGNWWHGYTWNECRTMVSRYFGEIASEFQQVSEPARQLQEDYAGIAAALHILSNPGMDTGEKIDLLTETREKEVLALERASKLAALLRATQDTHSTPNK